MTVSPPATLRLVLLAGATFMLSAVSAEAQTQNPEATARTYAAAEFARFAPQNALDMLNQVPGFIIRQATVERGLGEATGNVLLNGQRISNKSDDIVAQLRRIPAGNVVRIEISDGAQLGIPGLSGQVANVVSRAGGLTGRWAYRPEFRARFTDPLLTRFETSVSGEQGPFEYTIGLENQSSHSGAGGDTLIYNATGALTEDRFEVFTGKNNQPRLSARIVYDGPGDAVGNLNAAARIGEYVYEEVGVRQFTSAPTQDRHVDETQDSWDYEIGGDYEFGWGVGRLKLIALDRLASSDYGFLLTIDYANGQPRFGDRIARDSEEGERIGRAEYGWKSGETDWRFSVEAAFNSLESATRRFALQPSGQEVEVAFPNATARVQEDRYEAVGSWGRPLSPTLSLQASAGGEYSQITQVGANGLSREFFRPKGQLNAVWQAAPDTRVNLRLARRVGQLNFSDFLASANPNSGTALTGNPDLVPQQSWDLEAEINRSHGAWGSTTLRFYGSLIEDIIDIIPTSATGEAIGNLDEAQRYGVEFRTTTNFDPIGWRGLRLDSRFILQRSQVEDPLTGDDREISGSLKRFASLTLRHDVPETDWAWGASLSHQKSAQTYRLSELSRSFEIPLNGSFFVEHKDVFGLTVRATAGNIFSGESYFYRTGYAGRRTDPIAYFERRDRTIGPIFSFEIRDTF